MKEETDEISSKSYIDLDAKPKSNNSSRKLNEPEEKITEKDSKHTANSNLNVENANEVQEEHSKPRRNRDLAFFF